MGLRQPDFKVTTLKLILAAGYATLRSDCTSWPCSVADAGSYLALLETRSVNLLPRGRTRTAGYRSPPPKDTKLSSRKAKLVA